MCGIWVLVGEEGSLGDPSLLFPKNSNNTNNAISRRGPDAMNWFSNKRVCMCGSVLHMRGLEVVTQPVVLHNDDDNQKDAAFCWNGEVYEILHPSSSSNDDEWVAKEIPREESDTRVLAKLLEEALSSLPSSSMSTTTTTTNNNDAMLQAVARVFGRVWNGEYAFALVVGDCLYYGRDALGRRSLLQRQQQDSNDNDDNNNGLWILSSVAYGSDSPLQGEWSEVPPGRVFERNAVTGEVKSITTLFPHEPKPQPTQRPFSHRPMEEEEGKAIASESMWNASCRLEELLVAAVRRRMFLCSHNDQDHPIGILFSGGLDSAVLAAMAAGILEEENRPEQPVLELFNVAFGSGQAADRRAAIQSYQEIKRRYHPNVHVRLVLVDVGDWDSVKAHDAHIQQLILPKTSVMDLNIGTALWFASRGIGRVYRDDDDDDSKECLSYESRCKILLVGMGADEQMGGYSRHRKAYQNGTLREELDMDVGRLWERNLGRDDRIVSDHGREARFPFLDVWVVQFLATTPLDNVCDFLLGPGRGDKRILRLVATRMGLLTASGLVKRAIQFGSRIAHESDKRRFGSRRKAKGEHSIHHHHHHSLATNNPQT